MNIFVLPKRGIESSKNLYVKTCRIVIYQFGLPRIGYTFTVINTISKDISCYLRWKCHTRDSRRLLFFYPTTALIYHFSVNLDETTK